MKLQQLLELTDEEALAQVQANAKRARTLKKQNSKPFDATKTDMPFYDKLLHSTSEDYTSKVVWMRPKDYVFKAADGFNTSYATLEKQRKSTTKVQKYVEMLQQGKTFPMLVLEYRADGKFKQEGLHRAFAAIEVGYTKIPVFIVTQK